MNSWPVSYSVGSAAVTLRTSFVSMDHLELVAISESAPVSVSASESSTMPASKEGLKSVWPLTGVHTGAA